MTKPLSATYSNNTSGYRGVVFHAPMGKWQARPTKAIRRIHLGLFDTAYEAHLAVEHYEKYGDRPWVKTDDDLSPEARAYKHMMEHVHFVPESGCWLFSGTAQGSGHGVTTMNNKQVLAHRVSYMANVGPIPPGMCICHKCDTPRCVNPAHLFLGTHADNMKDRADKYNKKYKGVRQKCAKPHARVTEGMVREIRASTESGRALARRLNLAQTTVSYIRLRKTWAHTE